MSTDSQLIHFTVTHIFQEGELYGWEFSCPTCGYCTRYIPDSKTDEQFEVLSIGDPLARHVSNQAPVILKSEPIYIENNIDESWLTPELRQQMEDLLRDVDMGDW